MHVSTILTLAVSILAAGTTAITGDEGVVEFQKLATATTAYNNQLSMVNEGNGLYEGYRASIGLLKLRDAFEASIAKIQEGTDPEELAQEVSDADASRILAEAKTFLDLLDVSLGELQRIYDITTTTPHHYDIKSALEPIISLDSSLLSISENLQIWLPIDKWKPIDNLFNSEIAKVRSVAKAYRTL